MKVVVIGTGYVGCVTAAVLAREGHHVIGVDTNPAKIESLARGHSPVLEPGLPELIRRVSLAGSLRATTKAREVIADADIIIVCVGTPSNGNGALDTEHVERVSEEIGSAVARHGGCPVVVLRSTVLPCIVEDLVLPRLERLSGKRVGNGFGLVVNPEFLREGSALEDFAAPQFTLVGTDEPRSAAIMQRLYNFLNAPFITTDRRTAALVKYTCNSFHAMKVAFANEIAALGAAAGIDGREVMRIFCLDRTLNLSAAYLKPGMPFGGSCLPKDLRALAHYGRHHDLPLPLLSATLESNRLQVEACVDTILAQGRARVGFFGLSFKAGTDDVRESPTVSIVERLLGKGVSVAIYDGRVSLAHLVGTNREYLEQHLPHIASLLRPSFEEAVAEADVLVIGNRDEEFRTIPELMGPHQKLIDLVGITGSRAKLAPLCTTLGPERTCEPTQPTPPAR